MRSSIFLQSEVEDPYELYTEKLLENSLHWDDVNKLWAVYSYKNCEEILTNPSAQIPAIHNCGLNEYALAITGGLARLSNRPHHDLARETAVRLFQSMRPISNRDILSNLLEQENNTGEIDWVEAVCRKLPLLNILKSFEFGMEDCEFVLDEIETFVKIMNPQKTDEDITAINEISKEIYQRLIAHLNDTPFLKVLLNDMGSNYKMPTNEILALCISNLAGIFIQSFGAGRGVLGNSLLQFLLREDLNSLLKYDRRSVQKSVVETLRFDPPVHNTRRCAVEDIHLGNSKIEKGQEVLVILASANRDPGHFKNADRYDIERNNNVEHLTFGTGSHMCVAKYFTIRLTTEALVFLSGKYKKLRLLSKNIEYEPMTNARLPKQILIALK